MNDDQAERNKYYIARRRSGKSVDEIAKAIGYDRSTIYKIEKGEISPSEQFITALSTYLNIELVNDDITFNTYVESIIQIIRDGIPKTDRVLEIDEHPQETRLVTLENEADLQNAILNLISDEILQSIHKDAGIDILWTGKNYEDFTDFYTRLYEEHIAFAVTKGVRVRHFLRDGWTARDKLDVIQFCLEKTLNIQDQASFKIAVIRDMYVQAYVSDIYHTVYSGNIMALTGSSLGEPSIGIWGNRPTELFARYIPFLEAHSEQRVHFFPQSDRKKFFESYGITEGRTGDWAMLQKLPANATRPLNDFKADTTWGKRTAEIERQRGGPNLQQMIDRSRISAQLFRDRLSKGRFRQIMSRTALEAWAKTGSNSALEGTIEFHSELLDNKDDIKARLKNIIGFMDSGNFHVGIADDKALSKLGWSDRPSENLAWVVQGDEATVFEGHKKIGKRTLMDEYHILINDDEFNGTFMRAFDEAWRSLGKDATDQHTVREFFLARLRDLG